MSAATATISAAPGNSGGATALSKPAKKKPMERLAFRLYAFAWSSPTLYELSMRIARLLQRFAVRDGRIGKAGRFASRLAPPLGAWTEWRDARPIAARSFREQWRAQKEGQNRER